MPMESSPRTLVAAPEAAAYVTLQRLLLPEPQICREFDLYVHTDPGAIVDMARSEIVFADAGRARFDTYMNLFNLTNWTRGCALTGLALSLQGEGRFVLRLTRTGAQPDVTDVLIHTVVTLTGESAIFDLAGVLDVSQPERGMLAVTLTALEAGRVTGGAWLTPAPAAPRALRLALSITTFRREAEVTRSARRIAAFLDGEGASLLRALGCEAHLFVVDNGQSDSLPEALQSDPRITLIANPNLGGAGGFARGLSAAEDGGFSHCLFMDDDAAIQMESLLRTVAWLQFARSPRAAVAGAMISNVRPWMMWENGAVFDRFCRPLFVGTDLRDSKAVQAMESAAARPKPRGFYGGWWFLAFPLAEVRRYPFPFFVRGDDISFSLANRFDTATINGVVSFQDDFSAKESPLTLYLDLRNHLHHHLVQDGMDIGPRASARIAFHFILRSLVRMHYDSVEAQLIAWEDVLKGPEFFAENADMAQKRPQIAALARSEAWRPAQPEDFHAPASVVDPGMRYGRRMKRLLNGLLVPFWGRFGRDVTVPVTHRGLIWPIWGARSATFLSGDETRAYRVTHSKARGWGLIWRTFRLYRRWTREYPALREAHRAGYERLAARAFWDSKFR